MAEGYDFAALAAVINGCGHECGDVLCAGARDRIEKALRDAYASGLERALEECPDDYCAPDEDACKHCGRIRVLADGVRRG